MSFRKQLSFYRFIRNNCLKIFGKDYWFWIDLKITVFLILMIICGQMCANQSPFVSSQYSHPGFNPTKLGQRAQQLMASPILWLFEMSLNYNELMSVYRESTECRNHRNLRTNHWCHTCVTVERLVLLELFSFDYQSSDQMKCLSIEPNICNFCSVCLIWVLNAIKV